MQQLIEKIFKEHDFALPQRKGDSYFYCKNGDNDVEYFLVDFINAEDLKGYLESNKAENMFALYEENRIQKNDIEKNTSLVLCIKVGNIKEGIQAIKNDILNIEENDYWFKKYTLIYSDEATRDLITESNILEQLNNSILDTEVFKAYKDDIYLNEQYFVIIQLFLKLPFLIVPTQTQANYRTITDILALKLTDTDINLRETIRTVEEIDSSEFWDSFKSNLLDSTTNDDMIRQFINQFSTDAEA